MQRIRQGSAPAGATDLAAELVRIAALDTSELRSLWLKMTGKPPSRQLAGDLLRRMVMHRVQERSLGSLDRKLAVMLDRFADGSRLPPTRLKLGTVLVREHDGALHQVMVLPDGYAWNGRVLPSLSAAANAITGTKWNGHRFFGLHRSMAAQAGPRDRPSPSDRSQADLREASP